MAQEETGHSFITRTAGAGANSPYAQAFLETGQGDREQKRGFDERLEVFKLAMDMQREERAEDHQKMIFAHQLAMEQHQMRMEQVAMERERITAEKTAKKEADENKRELVGLRIQNELDPAALNYTQKRAELMKDPDVLSAITGTQGSPIYKLLKDSDKEHKDHATYWQNVLKENHVQGDYRNPNVIPQDEEGRPVWNDNFQKTLQQGNLDFQRAEANRPRTAEEQKSLDLSRQSDWKTKTGGLDYRYSQARLNTPNPKGVTAKTGFIDANTNKFTPDPAGDFVQYTDAQKRGFVSAPIPRNVHDEHNTYFQQGIQQQQAAESQLGVNVTPGVWNIEDPVPQEKAAKSIDLGAIWSPQEGMEIKAGDIPISMQGSQGAKFSGTQPATIPNTDDPMMQSAAAGGGQAAPFAPAPEGQPKSSEAPVVEPAASSSPSPSPSPSPAPAGDGVRSRTAGDIADVGLVQHWMDSAPEGSINAMNKKIQTENLKRGFLGSLEHMFSN